MIMIFIGIVQILRFDFQKFRILEILNFHPCYFMSFFFYFQAVECNREDCVKLLLEHRAEVDASDTEGNTGLHFAVKYGYMNIILVLINAGSNLNIKNKARHIAQDKQNILLRGAL